MPGKPLTTASGRPAAFGTRVRERIDSTKIVRKMCQHIENAEETPMTQTQLTAARILLDRTVPVLKPIEVAHGDGDDAKSISDRQLLDVIEGRAKVISVD